MKNGFKIFLAFAAGAAAGYFVAKSDLKLEIDCGNGCCCDDDCCCDDETCDCGCDCDAVEEVVEEALEEVSDIIDELRD